MTAETLKPFITPTSVAHNNFPTKHSSVTHSQRKIKHLIPVVLGIVAAALVIGILVLTIWQTVRVQQLETDLNGLQKDVESLRRRLGINYLEELDEFENEYEHRLIDDPNNDELDNINEYDENDDDMDDMDTNVDNQDDDVDNDDDDEDPTTSDGAEDNSSSVEDDYDEYLDLINQETNGNHTKLPRNNAQTESSAASSSSASNDDNVFEDFNSYNDSKKKKERKSRSIAVLRNELQSNEVAPNQNQTDTKTVQHSKENVASTESLPHHHNHRTHSRSHHRRHHRVMVRKGESPVSARSVNSYSRPAAHFHLYDKIPRHRGHHSLHGITTPGDIYLGKVADNMNNQQAFTVDGSVLTVHEAGLYFVYAQICYNNKYDENGFFIYHTHTPFLQCLITVPTEMPAKTHTCHTSGLVHLERDETIHLRDIHSQREVFLREPNNRSYFGIIKI